MDVYLKKMRKLCFSFPEISERTSHGYPCFFFRDKKVLAMYRPNEEPSAIWCPAEPGALETWRQMEAEMFYYPPYFGPRGWLGIKLTSESDWDLIYSAIRFAFIKITPKKISETLE